MLKELSFYQGDLVEAEAQMKNHSTEQFLFDCLGVNQKSYEVEIL